MEGLSGDGLQRPRLDDRAPRALKHYEYSSLSEPKVMQNATNQFHFAFATPVVIRFATVISTPLLSLHLDQPTLSQKSNSAWRGCPVTGSSARDWTSSCERLGVQTATFVVPEGWPAMKVLDS